MVVEWQPRAIRDLKSIFDYRKEVAGVKNAREICEEIVRAGDSLGAFPEMAAAEPSLSGYPGLFRALVVTETYKVIYHVDKAKNRIAIVTIWDCRQSPFRLKKLIKDQ